MIPDVETISCEEVAKQLKTTHPIVKAAIKNGTMPIGFVGSKGKTERTVIVKKRYLAWINAQDLTVKQA